MENSNDILSTILDTNNFFSLQSNAASTHANSVDPLYAFLVWSSLIIFLCITIPLIWFCIKYRQTTCYNKAKAQIHSNTTLEIMWTILPIIYVSYLFIWGFYGYLNLSIIPPNAKELKIIGQKWIWGVTYPHHALNVSGQGATIYVPINKSIKLTMSSQDVIHSFSVPNFRIKQDVVPGRYTTTWFKANKLGEYPIFCTEYCGDQHSKMLAKIKVTSIETFNKWLHSQTKQNSNLSSKELGRKLYLSKGCIACHSTDGSSGIAPTFKNIYNSTHLLNNGKTIKVNDNRIKQKLLNPQINITKGFPPIMPTFKGQLNEVEIMNIIEYLKSIK